MGSRTEQLLRIAVAFSFLYPPISALFAPELWIGYFPGFLFTLPVEGTILLHIFGAVEILLALLILFARSIAVPSLIAAGILIIIVLFNSNQLPVLFRDLSIALAALALAGINSQRYGISSNSEQYG